MEDGRVERCEYDGLTPEAEAKMRADLDEFVQHVKRMLAEGTFQAAVFSVMSGELDTNGETMLCHAHNYRHGYEDRLRPLLMDMLRHSIYVEGSHDHEH